MLKSGRVIGLSWGCAAIGDVRLQDEITAYGGEHGKWTNSPTMIVDSLRRWGGIS